MDRDETEQKSDNNTCIEREDTGWVGTWYGVVPDFFSSPISIHFNLMIPKLREGYFEGEWILGWNWPDEWVAGAVLHF